MLSSTDDSFFGSELCKILNTIYPNQEFSSKTILKNAEVNSAKIKIFVNLRKAKMVTLSLVKCSTMFNLLLISSTLCNGCFTHLLRHLEPIYVLHLSSRSISDYKLPPN